MARDVLVQGSPGCLASDEIAARIDERAPNGPPTRIQLTRTKVGFHGELLVGERSAPRLARSIDAKTCSAVVEAIALVVALDRDDETVADTPTDVAKETPAARVPESVQVSPSSDSSPKRTRWAIGSSLVVSDFSKQLGETFTLQSVSLFVDAAAATPSGGIPFLQPSARISLAFTMPTMIGRSTAKSPSPLAPAGPKVSILTHRLDLCPIGGGLHGWVGFAACVRGEMGVLLESYNAGVDPPIKPPGEPVLPLTSTTAFYRSSAPIFWGAAGPVGRMRFVFGRSASPFLEIEGGGLFPLALSRRFEGVSSFLWTAGGAFGVVLP